MELLVVVFVVGLVLMWVGRRAQHADDSTPPKEETRPPPQERPGDEAKTVARHYVHRSSVILGLDASVKGVALARVAHEQLLELTDLDVMVVLEDPTRPDGALLPVTDALNAEGIADHELQAGLLRAADAELAALPFSWVTRAAGVVACESSDGRAPARLLRLELFVQLPFPRERAVVMVPTLDCLVVADAERPAALEAMVNEAEARFTGAHWFSLTPLRWDGAHWRPGFPETSEDLRRRMMKLAGRGVLVDFRDAMEGAVFPAARTAVVGPFVNATWLEGTSVVVPQMRGTAMLSLIENRDEAAEVSLTGDLAAALVECVEREGHPSFPVLDEALFPPHEVLAFLETFDDAERQFLEWSPDEVLAALKRDGGLVFPLEQPMVLFADGRSVTLSGDVDLEALVRAMPGPELRVWSERVRTHQLERAGAAAALLKALTLAKNVSEDGDARETLATLEAAHALAPLQGPVMAAAVELALKTEDRDLIRTWVRRGVKEQPLNQAWRAALTALQFSGAHRDELAAKKPFDAASWSTTQSTKFDEAGPRATLMPVLRPPGHTERTQARMRELALRNGASPESILIQDPQRWPFARGLEIELVYDLGRKMQPLSTMDATGGLATELKDVALLNLFAASAGSIPERDGAWFPDWTDGFAASRLLLEWDALDWMADASRPLDVIAFTPVYDSFLVAPANDAKALEAVVREAEQMVERAEAGWRTLLTGLPWRYDPGQEKWVEHTFPATHPLAARVAALEEKVVAARTAA